MGEAFSAQARKPLRAAIAGNDSKFDLGLTELGGFAGQSDGSRHGEFATAPKSEAVNGTDGSLAERFEKMEDALAKEGKILAVDGSTLREFGNVGAGNKGFLTGASEDKNPDRGVIARFDEGIA